MEPPGKKAKLDVTETLANTDAVRRFEAEGTLGVDVADGTVMVHPALLGLASPVFAAMLCTDMHEKLQQKLNLPGKKKADLQLFLEFIRPGSRKRVDSDTVDIVLPWFDEYQVNDMKEECQTLLLTLPVDSQRLLQADRFGLARQYQRCLKELSFQDYKTSFADLAVAPAVLRDVRPHIEDKQPGAKRVCALVGNFIEKGGMDLKAMSPLIGACLTHDNGTDPLMDDAMLLLADLSKTSDPVHIATSMIELFLPKREATERSMMAVAREVEEGIPFRHHGHALVHAGNGGYLRTWVREKVEAAARLS